ncbi:UNVERIFIED_CONTAM: ATPase family AAA domain-containing protein 1 [Sesamum radiatum]|uniref:ATPase family AAA domain-containing protein 1 n=1 Tax=Sesamum radiatum TaxID=300843 RepID=A0AAW2JZ15_SESRA
MALWDGFTTDQHAQVMVLAATNRPSELDEAILRRLPQAFEIGIPDRRERTAILKVILKDEKVEGGIDYDHIAGLCDGYTGSDILELCKKAAYFPIRDLLNNEKTGRASQEPRPLSQFDLETVIATTRKTNVAARLIELLRRLLVVLLELIISFCDETLYPEKTLPVFHGMCKEAVDSVAYSGAVVDLSCY